MCCLQMFAQRLANTARPLVRQVRVIPTASRSFIVGFPRGPATEPMDPKYYPSLDNTFDPGMVGALGVHVALTACLVANWARADRTEDMSIPLPRGVSSGIHTPTGGTSRSAATTESRYAPSHS